MTRGRSGLDEAVAQIGDRWTLLIVDALLPGPRRFGELQQELAGLAPNVLSSRLKQLLEQGLTVAEPYSRRPLRHAYRLSAAGEELAGVLRLLAQWGAGRGGSGEDAVPVHHRSCGTAVEARWYCPTCGQLVDDDHLDDLHYA